MEFKTKPHIQAVYVTIRCDDFLNFYFLFCANIPERLFPVKHVEHVCNLCLYKATKAGQLMLHKEC